MSMNPNKRCAVIETLKVFSAKWKPCILSFLFKGNMRYGELQRLIPDISRKMLTQHLKRCLRPTWPCGGSKRDTFPQ